MAEKRTGRNRGNKRLFSIFRESKRRKSRGGENGQEIRSSKNILSSSSLKNAAPVPQKIKIVRKRLKKLSSSSLKKVKQPGNGAEIMKTPLYIFNYRGGHTAARLVLVPSKGNRRNGIAGAVREERPPQKSDSRKDGKGAKANDSNKNNV